MFHTPDYYHNMSMRLSEVLSDIGVNENIVMKRRWAALLLETMITMTSRASGSKRSFYNLGSTSEGTTTQGLDSDFDLLSFLDDFIVIQNWSEWVPGKRNFLMIQNERTPPGYCLLQALRSDAPLPAKHEKDNIYVKDTSGRILCRNTVIYHLLPGGCHREGPSAARAATPGFRASDLVAAFPCESWPQSPRAWLDRQEANTWPTAEMKEYAKTTKCCLVGVGSRASENTDFEWRLSTSLAERSLMFNLNITQIRCYILMKMILKTYINVDNEGHISSYMCKTVLLHCITNTDSNIWKECNILNCLNSCLCILHTCIVNQHCSHYIVPENNLMAGQFSTEVKHQLLEKISHLIPCDGISLFGIHIDNFGERLQRKLNIINEVHHDIPQPDEYTTVITGRLLREIAKATSFTPYSEDASLETLLQRVMQVRRYYRAGNMLGKTACRLIAPRLCTSIGCLIAAQNIRINNTVSPQALTWIEQGLDSDVSSSRLKLASIMYCTGNAEISVLILSHIEERYIVEATEPVCVCYDVRRHYTRKGFCKSSSQYSVEKAIQCSVAFCVKFSIQAIHCVPHELQYEMFRSTQDDIQHRDEYDEWMDCAVVDSLPYLYFLQYKTNRNLQRPEEQQQSLNKLIWVIESEPNLAHRETALNLLGQCMELENRTADALRCYMLSLRYRERNNAARFHICRCLAGAIS